MSSRRGYALARDIFTSFDRRCSVESSVQRPDRYRSLEQLPADALSIPRGGGVSYVGASFAADAISQDMSAFDRLLEFDPERGLLRVEAGAHIADVMRFVLAHGWSLPVAPGHPHASIGGCVAADVHGKNPARDGTFRDQVDALEVLDSNRAWQQLSASNPADQIQFAAQFAGFGIPGLITSVSLRLQPAAKAYSVRRLPVRNLIEAAEVLRAHASAPLLYGWHDGRSGRFGRGVIRFGLESHDTPAHRRQRPDLPASIAPGRFTLWSRAGIAAANTLLGQRWCRPGSSTLSPLQAMFPLNGARGYFAGFGRDGMVEAQWLLPHGDYAGFVQELEKLVQRLQPCISLISSKLFSGRPEGFAFDGEGIALSMQFPAPDTPSQRDFLRALTELAIAHHGRPNLIKDSSLDAEQVRRAMPDFESARATLRHFDPQALRQSALTRRLQL